MKCDCDYEIQLPSKLNTNVQAANCTTLVVLPIPIAILPAEFNKGRSMN